MLGGRSRTWSRIVALNLIALPAIAAEEDPCSRSRIGGLALELFDPAADRKAAVEALGECQTRAVVGLLEQKLLHDESAAVRSAAARELVENPAPEAEATLRRVIRGNVPRSLRSEIERGLATRSRRAAPAAPEPVEETFDSPFATRTAPPPTAPPEPAPPVAESPSREGAEVADRAPTTPSRAPPYVRPPPVPEVPFAQQDGLPLAVTAAAVSGGTLFPYMAALAQQKSPLALTLTSAAGAVIGGGSAWGLSLFGMRPTMPQAVWFTNSTAWGAMAGLALHSGLVAGGDGSALDKDRALWGLLAAGQTAGMAGGIWSARAYQWTPQQIVFADGLLVGSYLAYGGGRLLADQRLEMNAPMAIATVPLMVGSAIGARYLAPTRSDVHLVSAATLASAWSGYLLGNATPSGPSAEERALGGLMLGTGAGFLGSVAASAFLETEPQRVWGSLGFVGAGNLLGLGVNMVADPLDDGGQISARNYALGTAVGGLAMGAAAYAAWPHLTFRPSTPGMVAAGAGYGSLTWLLATAAADPGVRHPEDPAIVAGGALAAGVAAGTAGLIASRWFDPRPFDHAVVATGTGLGVSAGLGAARLIASEPAERGLPDLIGVLGGSTVGFATAAYLQHRTPFDGTDLGAELAGASFGAMYGALIPTAGNPEWISSGVDSAREARLVSAGTLVGAAAGGVAAAAVAHSLDVRPGQVVLPTLAASLGTLMGTGLGMAVDNRTSQLPRIGAVTGSAVMAAAAIASDPVLHLSEGLGPSAPELALTGGVLGTGYGLLLSEAMEFPGSGTTLGGVLFGSSAGLATGLALSRFHTPPPGGWVTLTAGTFLGGLLGRGVATLSPPPVNPVAARRVVALSTLGGALAGTVGATVQNHFAPLQPVDALASGVGGLYGGVLGFVAPTLDSELWPTTFESSRQIAGGTMVGISAGAIGAALLRRNTGASNYHLWTTSLGGLNGALTGVGVGLLLSPTDGSSSRPERVGLVAGTSAGLLIGATVWPDVSMEGSSGSLIRTASLVGGWTGLWLPTVGEENLGVGVRDRALGKRMLGGAMAGFGAGAFASSLIARFVQVEPDRLDDALAMYAIGSGLGAGAGALFSPRHDVTTGAMLATGTAGLVAGALLHEQISFGQHVPLTVALGAEGAWLGGWTAVLLSQSPEGQPLMEGVTGRTLIGGTAAGALAGVGTAALIGSLAPVQSKRSGVALATSALAASIAGGTALLVPALENRWGVGLLMASSAVGFVGGGYLSDQLVFNERTVPYTLLGAGLGLAEANAFAWASEASSAQTYAGASLIGAGVGTALGLSASAAAGTAVSDAPAAAGFAAWGAWIGAFTGALAFRDGGPEVHRVSLGGLIGANAGFVVGLGLMRTKVIESRDIGWLSLFGGAGTLLAAGVTAPFSSAENPAPILAGLAIGPVVGMAAGGFIWPRVRGPETPVPARVTAIAPGSAAGFGLGNPFQVSEWQPMISSLPPLLGTNEAPMLIGATGTLW